MKKEITKNINTILSTIIILLLIVIIILLIHNFVKEEDNNKEEDSIKTKLVDNLHCGNSNTSFNNINVDVIHTVKEDGGLCSALVNINDEEVINTSGEWLISYEYFDNNVILLIGSTDNLSLNIYNVDSKKIVFDSLKELNDYRILSYKTSENKMTLEFEGCGSKCNSDNDGEIAIYELYYNNNTFSDLNLIRKY